LGKYFVLVALNTHSFAFFDENNLLGIVNPESPKKLLKHTCAEEISLQLSNAAVIFTKCPPLSLLFDWSEISYAVLVLNKCANHSTTASENITEFRENIVLLPSNEPFSLSADIDIIFPEEFIGNYHSGLAILDHGQRLRMIFLEMPLEKLTRPDHILNADITIIPANDYLISLLENAITPADIVKGVNIQTEYLVILTSLEEKMHISEILKSKHINDYVLPMAFCDKLGFTRHLYRIKIIKRLPTA